MQFDHLRSLITSGKTSFSAKIGAFLAVASERNQPYIEPSFEKIMFEHGEKPAVILVSAVGATGKSTLAQVLSSIGQLPILDLSVHKAVGDNTISGLLTNTYAPEDLSGVFVALREGNFGVIIDGLDEGRSKTTEQGFEAFLDDIASLCNGSPRPSFVLLGRTDIVTSTYLYLVDKGATVGVISINPFDIEQANRYIDEVSGVATGPHLDQYMQARDAILGRLSGAFSGITQETSADAFLAFIGYPPVLDAVATVLSEEKNFFKLQNELAEHAQGDREIDLLEAICRFILDREQREKVWPNILECLCANLNPELSNRLKENAFSVEEQCARLLAYCLEKPVQVSTFSDVVLDAQFEERLSPFLPEHPFLTGRRFRNAVFEAFALAVTFFSSIEEYRNLAIEYADKSRLTYHFVYLAARVSKGKFFPLKNVRVLIGASQDFRAQRFEVFVELDGTRAIDDHGQTIKDGTIEVRVSVMHAGEEKPSGMKLFPFTADQIFEEVIDLGSSLANTFGIIPTNVMLRSSSDIKLIAPISLITETLYLSAPGMTVSGAPGTQNLIASLTAVRVESELTSLSEVGAKLRLNLPSSKAVTYPLTGHVSILDFSKFDPDFKPKYLKLRKLLTHFRSHSKGRLAKLADKIENERVAGNDSGGAILDRLLADKILTREGIFFFVDPEKVDALLGVNWTDLRDGNVPQKLVEYLKAIPIG